MLLLNIKAGCYLPSKMKKICSKCKKELDISSFAKAGKYPDNSQKYQSCCKICKSKDMKIYYIDNKESRREYRRAYDDSHKDSPEFKERRKISDKKYYLNNRDKVNQYHRQWQLDNIDKTRIYKKRYRKKYPNKEYEYKKARQKIDPEYAATISARNMINRVLNQSNIKKESRTFDLLGYTACDLKDHLESLFQIEMSWNNRSEWDIHHIQEVSSFKLIKHDGLLDITALQKCNSLLNLIPLWKDEHKAVHHGQ
jgi:hypothetical protein